jgi:hypothetical protein
LALPNRPELLLPVIWLSQEGLLPGGIPAALPAHGQEQPELLA